MAFQLHPLLSDPHAVLIYRAPVSAEPTWEEFRRVAYEALTVMQVVLSGEKVVIKPNVTSGEYFANPDSGITTHPAFVGGIVEYVRDHGARRGGIYIVEDPRDSDDYNPRHWKGTGYLEVAEETGAKIRCPISYTCVKKAVPRPLVHPVRNVSRLAVAPDAVLINVPKMKTHNLAITTLCLKNLMGLDDVWDRHYCAQAWKELPPERVHDDRPKKEWMDEALHERWQEGLARRLADLAQVIQPHLNMVEGVVGRDGTGFNRGRNFPLGMVIAGINMVAVDSVTSYLMGFDPQRLVYLRTAAEIGLGCNDLSQLRIYTVADKTIVPCEDLDSVRAKPPFRVIRDIMGEEVEAWDAV
jgi:uncharacterized protein (DUF362 family)